MNLAIAAVAAIVNFSITIFIGFAVADFFCRFNDLFTDPGSFFADFCAHATTAFELFYNALVAEVGDAFIGLSRDSSVDCIQAQAGSRVEIRISSQSQFVVTSGPHRLSIAKVPRARKWVLSLFW